MSWNIVMQCPICGMLREYTGGDSDRDGPLRPVSCFHEYMPQSDHLYATMYVVHVEKNE